MISSEGFIITLSTMRQNVRGLFLLKKLQDFKIPSIIITKHFKGVFLI